MGLIINQYAFGVAYDSDAQTFFTNAGITDTAHKEAINTFVVGLKAASLWTPMKAMYLGFLGSAAKCKFNLKDPRDLDAAFRLGFSGGWTYASSGMTPNGTNGYANTYCAPNQMAQNSIHYGLYSRTDRAGANNVSGSSITNDNLLYPRYVDNTMYGGLNFNGANYASKSVTDTLGLIMVSRTGATVTNVYKNGVAGTVGPAASVTPISLPFFLSANNENGLPVTYDNLELSFASIGDGLTDQNATDLSTLVNAMMTTLGINVY